MQIYIIVSFVHCAYLTILSHSNYVHVTVIQAPNFTAPVNWLISQYPKLVGATPGPLLVGQGPYI